MTEVVSSEILGRVVSNVLEEAAFTFVVSSDFVSGEETWPQEILVTDITFHGPERFLLRTATTREFGLKLAGEILGEEVAPGEGGISAPAGDALGEIANMAAGMLVENLYGPGGSWELGIPQVRPMSPLDYLEEREGAVAGILLEDEDSQPFEVCLFEPREDSEE